MLVTMSLNPLTYFQLIPTLAESYYNTLKLNHFYNLIYFKTFEENLQNEPTDTTTKSFYKSWMKLVDREIDKELKSDSFKSLLADYTNSIIKLRGLYREIGYPVDYFDSVLDTFRREYMHLLSLSKDYKLSKFEVINKNRKTRLLHYSDINIDVHNKNNCNSNSDRNEERNSSISRKRQQQPLLIVYAPINRFHIMDLNPKTSVVRSLLSHGIDVYLLDLGYATKEDSYLSLADYVEYVNDAVQVIKAKTGLDKISILGYCWGGILALMYAAQKENNTKNIKSLALMATPVDFSKDDTTLANWSRAVDIDKMMDEFGGMSGYILDLLFVMRNPPRYAFDKYLKLLDKLNDSEFVDTFFDVEKWLYDTPSIPGTLFRQIITKCYKENLLVVPNKIEINHKEIGKEKVRQQQQYQQSEQEEHNERDKINLGNITVPLLMIDAQKDDLVTTDSALALSNYTSSKEKKTMINPGGHVALCISDAAHKKLWPEVAEWILST